MQERCEERRAYCPVHEEYIASIEVLNNNIAWLTKIGKWVVGTLVTVALVVMGAVTTFSYKAGDAYAQIQTNTKSVELLTEVIKKEITHGR